MKLEEIKNQVNKIIKNFINELEFDGDYYIATTNCPVAFANIVVPGEFYAAESKALNNFLEKINMDSKKKDYINSEGLILVNKKYKEKPIDADLLVTLIHEQLHSNRMFLINTQYSEKINSIFFDDGRFVQNSNSSQPYYVDASQDVFKGSFDNSKETINKYVLMSDEEKEEISFMDEKFGEKMDQQFKIDESLVETMAIVAYQLYNNKGKNIMEILHDINKIHDAEDIKAITNIILRHNDLELFNWMIDPLSYQVDDINYDFFSHYIDPGDFEDVNVLTNSNEITFDDDHIDDIIEASRRI